MDCKDTVVTFSQSGKVPGNIKRENPNPEEHRGEDLQRVQTEPQLKHKPQRYLMS